MKRLPFGIASSGALFQDAVDRVLEGVEGCRWYLDDLLVFGEDEQELLERLEEVLSRLQRQGLRLSSQKCRLAVPEVEFLGWKVTGDGIIPTDSGGARTAVPMMPGGATSGGGGEDSRALTVPASGFTECSGGAADWCRTDRTRTGGGAVVSGADGTDGVRGDAVNLYRAGCARAGGGETERCRGNG